MPSRLLIPDTVSTRNTDSECDVVKEMSHSVTSGRFAQTCKHRQTMHNEISYLTKASYVWSSDVILKKLYLHCF